MESERGSPVVVSAGHPDRTETFFASGPGLSSRVAHPVESADHTHEELTAIAEVVLVQDAFRFHDEAREGFEYLELRMAQPWFVNARRVRNAPEPARPRRQPAGRDRRGGRPEDLMTLTAADVRARPGLRRGRAVTGGDEEFGRHWTDRPVP